jgi:glutamine synthetase
MLMAGLDGIKNKLDPGKDLYDLPKEELKNVPTVRGSMREALESLDKDRALLKSGGVFDDDFIDSYIEQKMSEVARFEMTPHPGRVRPVLFVVSFLRRRFWKCEGRPGGRPFCYCFWGKCQTAPLDVRC